MSERNQLLSISAEGDLLAIYNDDLADLIAENGAEIKRVSQVEPCERCGQWSVRMTNGIYLGCFKLRKDALEAEMDYLTAQLFD